MKTGARSERLDTAMCPLENTGAPAVFRGR